MLVNIGAALSLLGALLLAPVSTSAEQYPAFLDDIRKAIVSAGSYGVLAGPTRILSIQHGTIGQLKLGAETSVTFRGLWESLHPEQARVQSIAPAEFRRTARLLCAFKDIDVSWLELLGAAPDGVTPVRLSDRITTRLYVLPIVRGMPRVVTATFTGRYGHVDGVDAPLPTLEMQGATGFPGWSGSPVVNDRGEVVGLVSGGKSSSIHVALPLKTCDR